MPPKDPVPVVADEEDDTYTKDNVTEYVLSDCRSINVNIMIQG